MRGLGHWNFAFRRFWTCSADDIDRSSIILLLFLLFKLLFKAIGCCFRAACEGDYKFAIAYAVEVVAYIFAVWGTPPAPIAATLLLLPAI